eukprot:1311501-Amphidinium_carterae.1
MQYLCARADDLLQSAQLDVSVVFWLKLQTKRKIDIPEYPDITSGCFIQQMPYTVALLELFQLTCTSDTGRHQDSNKVCASDTLSLTQWILNVCI